MQARFILLTLGAGHKVDHLSVSLIAVQSVGQLASICHLFHCPLVYAPASHSVGQLVGQSSDLSSVRLSTSCPVSQSYDPSSVSLCLSQPLYQVGGSVGRSVGGSVRSPVGQFVHQSVSQSVSSFTSRSVSQSVRSPVSQSVSQFTSLMHQSNRSFNIPPPQAYPRHLTPFPAREGGNLITTHRGGEFDHQPGYHITSRADSTSVYKSWRRRRRQTLMNSKEKIAYSWRIG